MSIGAHVSIAGGVEKAPARLHEVGGETLQVFVRSNLRWSFPALEPAGARAFRKAVKELGISPVLAHASYLDNLASSSPDIRRRSFENMIDEVRRCHTLGISGLVIHPGAHPANPHLAVELLCNALNDIIEQTSDTRVRVLLETTAGQGSQLGGRFEELRAVIDGIKKPKRIGVCVDTCHIFAAGYDIRTREAYERTFAEFDSVVGIGQIHAFHANDCKGVLGSRLDRHQHIGRGHIGKDAFGLLVNDPRFARLPVIIETPKKDDWDVKNISLLKELRGR